MRVVDELGLASLDAQALLTIAISPPDQGAPLRCELEALADGIPLRVDMFGEGATWEALVPAGRYRLRVLGRGAPVERELQLLAGLSTGVELDARLAPIARQGTPVRSR